MMRSTREPSSSWGSRERSTAAVSTSSSSWWMGPASCPCAYLQQTCKAGVRCAVRSLDCFIHGRQGLGPTDNQACRDGHQVLPKGLPLVKGSTSPFEQMSQVLRVQLQLLQALPAQSLEPYAFHQRLEAHFHDACIGGSCLRCMCQWQAWPGGSE